MKRLVLCCLFVFMIASILSADGLSKILSDNINKKVDIFLKNYTPMIADLNASSSTTLHGVIIECTDEILKIRLKGFDRWISSGKTPALIYIRVSEIAAIQIEE